VSSQAEQERLCASTRLYQEGLSAGLLPQGKIVSPGAKSAFRFVMERTGLTRHQVGRDLDLARRSGLLPKTPEALKPEPTPLADAFRLGRGGPIPAYVGGPLHTFTTEADGTFTFGASGDQHLSSKYERLDVLEELYTAFADEGCHTVFNTGNWIDGEARFNVHDLHTHGMDAQMRYAASVWPVRPGITTYAVSGDDHEGWYSQSMGVDVGRYMQNVFHEAGRSDWVDLGYMEAPVRLRHAKSGAEAIISIVHPGGGSAYAVSYTVQKIIESLDGGEKPAVLLAGHYHKLWVGNIRNVWAIQTGTCQDQTPFMRKKKLEAHVGGVVCRLTQDPKTGAVTRCRAEMLRYFNRGYYANRWSHHGPVAKAQRVA
jgi:hypothetical protein